MPKIVTITFSPCIDKSTSIPALMPERKLKCAAPKLEPGGGGINVARAIKKLGSNATAIFPSGGYTGKFFNYLMERENVPTIIIETKNESRENIIVFDKSSNFQYRFGMPGTELAETEWKQCLEAVEAMEDVEFLIASGSLPPGVPDNIYAQLAKIASNKKIKLVVDTAEKALEFALEEGVYMIKPNIGELSFLAGKNRLMADEVSFFAKEIIAKGKCEVIVISMGAAGAMLVTKDTSETIAPPAVVVQSTVGAGDSMVAGIIYSLSQGKNISESFQYGVACGTAATTRPGTELCRKEEAERLYVLIQKGQCT